MAITRLLIANRGEIAVRIARTARRLGIGSVAVFSEADRGACHVRLADQAVPIGPAAAAQSYLSVERILTAAAQSGADAVHPGYGFLSENADFAEAVINAGLVWVGPPAEAIRAMGLKDAARALAAAEGVPVLGGIEGLPQDAAALARAADSIGYPLIVKAVAGGGGKGMRRVDRAADLAEALARAGSEASAAFGNPRLLIERLLPDPRHVEVQVVADTLGNVVHLLTRDCSAQRRHQKVVEEAPAPDIDPARAEEMAQAACAVARRVGYVGAGTVEFLFDGNAGGRGNFYFLEMNTRLQVEHPVTEAITGLDLVEWQIRVAEGAPLPMRQAEIGARGHAVEARIYAEDPAAGFAPRTGRLTRAVWPKGTGIRVDAGVSEGDTVGAAYDPLIAKIIAHAQSRQAALSRLEQALAETHLGGLVTNLGFLARLVADPAMAKGAPDTELIERHGMRLTEEPAPDAADLGLAAAALASQLPPKEAAFWRPWGAGRSRVSLAWRPPGGTGAGETTGTVAFSARSDQGGTRIDAETPAGTSLLVASAIDAAKRKYAVSVLSADGAPAAPTQPVWLYREGRELTLVRPDRRLRIWLADLTAPAEDTQEASDALRAPLPGILRRLDTVAGAQVSRGDRIAVIEAMKMEHALVAPRDGVVASAHAGVGDAVAQGSLIVTLAPEAAEDPQAEGGAP